MGTVIYGITFEILPGFSLGYEKVSMFSSQGLPPEHFFSCSLPNGEIYIYDRF